MESEHPGGDYRLKGEVVFELHGEQVRLSEAEARTLFDWSRENSLVRHVHSDLRRALNYGESVHVVVKEEFVRLWLVEALDGEAQQVKVTEKEEEAELPDGLKRLRELAETPIT